MKEIPLTRGKVALVDDEDYERVSQFGWYALQTTNNRNPYATRLVGGRGRQKRIYLHRFILNAPSGLTVDHINGNGLDNRKANLRLASVAENVRSRQRHSNNTSGFKGVCRSKTAGKWVAKITVNGQRYHLGLFTCPIEAAKAYDAAAREHFGAFARVNFPHDGEVAA